MQKNGARKALLVHRQTDSEILTKILEKKTRRKAALRDFGSPKAEVSKPESGENSAFSLGKQCFFREKTYNLTRGNKQSDGGKPTFCPAQTDVFGRLNLLVDATDERDV